ncbi:MAG: LuxR C-terminal-related transcriptional regulator [Sulfurimonadaceae bacterium]|jgi:DNA-binding NarL/FixJ family response regulator|nr:LuxR C-terminal-related transcriptional regulator [Sulfurimonadaceae bacterium]
MKLLFFTKNIDIVDELKKRHAIDSTLIASDEEELSLQLRQNPSMVVIADYDTVATEVNKFLSSNLLPQNLIVLERVPAILTGKKLLSRRVKAYGNTRMSSIHFNQMVQTVMSGNVWSYPELTAALIPINKQIRLNNDAQTFLNERLTPQEIEVVSLILEGFTNDAIASSLHITTRTVKAHITSIFTKLRVNDRLSLVLLLK